MQIYIWLAVKKQRGSKDFNHFDLIVEAWNNTLKNKIMVTTHNIEKISFDDNHIILHVNGKEVKVNLDKVSRKLKSANKVQRNVFSISPSGYGIHWPLIDEDLAIEPLLNANKG